jgi:hypothetical protein
LRRALLFLAVCCTLVYLVVAGSASRRFQRGHSLIIPVAPGRAVVVDVWPVAVLGDRFSPYSWSYSYSDLATNDRWAGIWYQNTVAGSRWRLLAFSLPTWPLSVAMVGIWLLLGATIVWPRLKRRSRTVE